MDLLSVLATLVAEVVGLIASLANLWIVFRFPAQDSEANRLLKVVAIVAVVGTALAVIASGLAVAELTGFLKWIDQDIMSSWSEIHNA
jgi:hypothetical protein